ncbi:MAG TPA: hypothetical protein VF473_02045 [Cyclobacteriaceae bacterium]
MKWLQRLLVVVFCSPLLISSCFSPPEYPDVPEIVFKSVTYVKGGLLDDGSQAEDSVILVLNFKDGDGDIGIATNELFPPFNDRWYITKSNLSPDITLPPGYDCSHYNKRCYYVDAAQLTKYVRYKDRRATAGYDTLKPFAKPYDCYNWQIIYQDKDNDPTTPATILDTLFYVLNPHYNNLFVEFEMKTDDPQNPFKAFDEKTYFTASCGVRIFYGRIPVLSEDLGRSTPLEGEIRYAIPSYFYTTIFGAKTLRLKVHIEDRALHQSNTVYTREFNLLENQ